MKQALPPLLNQARLLFPAATVCAGAFVLAVGCKGGAQGTAPTPPPESIPASDGSAPGLAPSDGGRADAAGRAKGDAAATADATSAASELEDGAAGEAGDDAGLGEPDASALSGFVRFADWAPDAPTGGFDVCLTPDGGTTWIGPLTGAGVGFPFVGRYAEVPPGEYDLRVVPPSAASCSSPVAAAVGLPFLTAGTHNTFALVGDMTPVDNDPLAKVVAFTDDADGDAARAGLRFVDATPASAAVDFGVSVGGGADAGYTTIAADVQFGAVSSNAPLGMAQPDSNGYLALEPQGSASLAALATGLGKVLATGSKAAWPAGSLVTVALVGGRNGGPPPELVLCRDDLPAQGALSACRILSP